MAKKYWIKIKRGLVTSPKHREAIGAAVWLYFYILDRADWETGIVYDWRDADVAAEMEVNPRTVRDWRQSLSAAGYITCVQKLRALNITVHKWVDPRSYSGEVLNDPAHGDTFLSPSNDGHGDTSSVTTESDGDTHGDTHGLSKRVTLPIPSHINNQGPKLPPGSDVSWKIGHGEAVTEEDLEPTRVADAAHAAFEKALGFGTLPWDSNRDWEKFSKFVIAIFRDDPELFKKYAAWRDDKGKFLAMSNVKIRTNLSAFMDTGWPTFMSTRRKSDSDRKPSGPAPLTEYERRIAEALGLGEAQ